MEDEYYQDLKKKLGETIPDFSSPEFKKLRDGIKEKLKKGEADYLFRIRSLKTLVLGDWYTPDKRRRLLDVRDNLLKHGLYAETIDHYYDIKKRGGLTQVQILETCCIAHQLIVFIDGDGKGTITEQNYLCENYALQGKVIFFIDESKFNTLKNNPSEYMSNFPSIITYTPQEILEKTLVYSRLRIYRLGSIIQRQALKGKGPHGPNYQPWSQRLGGYLKRK